MGGRSRCSAGSVAFTCGQRGGPFRQARTRRGKPEMPQYRAPVEDTLFLLTDVLGFLKAANATLVPRDVVV